MYQLKVPMNDRLVLAWLRQRGLLNRDNHRRFKAWARSPHQQPLPPELNPVLDLFLLVQVLPPTPSLH